jgi:hypothetical protein
LKLKEECPWKVEAVSYISSKYLKGEFTFKKAK